MHCSLLHFFMQAYTVSCIVRCYSLLCNAMFFFLDLHLFLYIFIHILTASFSGSSVSSTASELAQPSPFEVADWVVMALPHSEFQALTGLACPTYVMWSPAWQASTAPRPVYPLPSTTPQQRSLSAHTHISLTHPHFDIIKFRQQFVFVHSCVNWQKYIFFL